MGGTVRRNLFTQWELDLLFDMQSSKLRKSSRADALRRYLRVVQHSHAEDATEPPRFSAFLEATSPRRAAAGGASK
jgi:hypothetical protein